MVLVGPEGRRVEQISIWQAQVSEPFIFIPPGLGRKSRRSTPRGIVITRSGSIASFPRSSPSSADSASEPVSRGVPEGHTKTAATRAPRVRPILPRLVPGCSVIVCTRHRPDLLARCLASLASMDGPEPETIVVDNTEGDRETKRVTARAGARYVVETRVGLSRARNTGIDAATGELIAFLDDDAIADSAWLSRHSEVLADESLTASTGRELPIATEPGQVGYRPARPRPRRAGVRHRSQKPRVV